MKNSHLSNFQLTLKTLRNDETMSMIFVFKRSFFGHEYGVKLARRPTQQTPANTANSTKHSQKVIDLKVSKIWARRTNNGFGFTPK